MHNNNSLKKIAIIGAGPAGLFMYKALIASATSPLEITIFEKQDRPGPGMPYSAKGAGQEHVTNVSANEIPAIVTPLAEWIQQAAPGLLKKFDIDPHHFNEYKVLPRLLFGEYLAAQFDLLQNHAGAAGIVTRLLLNCCVQDATDDPRSNSVMLTTADGTRYSFDHIIISTGHRWPKELEGQQEGWFDSPYPPAKLAKPLNWPVAIKGASLTAIDVIRTLSRNNGHFKETQNGLHYILHESSKDFRMVLHSLSGLLPATRFHLQDSRLQQGHSFTAAETAAIMEANDGFVPLDLVFDKNFREPLKEGQPELYERIRNMRMEEFVDHVMDLREKLDAFILLKAEYKEAERSIQRRQSVYWKELLAVLSYEMNYPAKHFSAEDMLRLKRKLMPLITIIIAFVPQRSCDELIALHNAGVLSLQGVDAGSGAKPLPGGGCRYHFTDEEGKKIQQDYRMFIDATGQPAFMIDDFIFPGLVKDGTVSEAHIKFRDAAAAQAEMANGNKQVLETAPGEYWMKVPGININDHFQVLDRFGTFNPRVHIMAVPYIAGLNPDYSGLDFCERASGIIAARLLKNAEAGNEAA